MVLVAIITYLLFASLDVIVNLFRITWFKVVNGFILTWGVPVVGIEGQGTE